MLITPNLWNFQNVLHILAETQEVPRHTRLHSGGARESRPNPEEPRFRLLAREEGSFPCLVGKELLAFPSHLKRGRFTQERREELQGRSTIPRVPQISQCAGVLPRWIQGIRGMDGVDVESLVYLLM